MNAAFPDTSEENLGYVTQVNYLSPAELCRQVIPRMLGRGGGHIVNISSMAGSVVVPGTVTYSASKAALSHFTAGLRVDLRGLPIGTTLVELGPIPTDMLAEIEEYEPSAEAFGASTKCISSSTSRAKRWPTRLSALSARVGDTYEYPSAPRCFQC